MVWSDFPGTQESTGGKQPSLQGSVCMHLSPLQRDRVCKMRITDRRDDRVLLGISDVSWKMSWETSISVTTTNVLGPCCQRCPSNTGATKGIFWQGRQPCPWLHVTVLAPLGLTVRDPESRSSLNHLFQSCPECPPVQQTGFDQKVLFHQPCKHHEVCFGPETTQFKQN